MKKVFAASAVIIVSAALGVAYILERLIQVEGRDMPNYRVARLCAYGEPVKPGEKDEQLGLAMRDDDGWTVFALSDKRPELGEFRSYSADVSQIIAPSKSLRDLMARGASKRQFYCCLGSVDIIIDQKRREFGSIYFSLDVGSGIRDYEFANQFLY